MLNPQTYKTNCCQFQFKHPLRKVQPRSIQKNVKTIQIEKQKKISLKNYSSAKHPKIPELTKISTQVPQNLGKSIIQELDSFDDKHKSRLSSLKEHNPFSGFRIQPVPHYGSQIQIQREPTKLQKSKSLTKVMFSYTFVQADTNNHSQVEYKVNVRQKKRGNSGIFAAKSQFGVSEIIKIQKQEDMRSTIQPLQQVQKTGMNRPKTIISINDQEEIQDFMNESLIIERHSKLDIIQRLL